MALGTIPRTATPTTGTGSEFRQQRFVKLPSETIRTAGEANIDTLFAELRRYARSHHVNMLELIAEHLTDDLPVSVAQFISAYLDDRKPESTPETVNYRAFFGSGRSDISERMEEIIYGPDSNDTDE